MDNAISKGDYVLATKWSDGNPMDQYCVGFYDGLYKKDRHLVVDENGNQFRHNGFRRVEKINKEEGRRLVAIFPTIERLNGCSLFLWEYLSKIRQEIQDEIIASKTDLKPYA